MVNLDVLMVLLDPGVHGTPCLSNVDLVTFARGCCTQWMFLAKGILDRSKETGHPSRGRPTVLMLCIDSTLLPDVRTELDYHL